MNRNVFFMTALILIGSLTFSACEKPEVETPRLEGYQLDLDFENVPDGALAVSLGEDAADSKVWSTRESAQAAGQIQLIAYRDADQGILLASPNARFLNRYLPAIKEWPTRQKVQIRKTNLSPEEASNLRQGEAAAQIREAFQLGESVGDGQMTAPVQEGEVYAIQLPGGDIVLAHISICIGVYTANGNCIGIYIQKDKDK